MTPDSEPHGSTPPTLPAPAASPSPADPAGQRTHPLSGLLNGLLWGAGVGAAFAFGQATSGEWLFAGGSLVGGFCLGMVFRLARWWFTRYVIDDTEVRVETGPIVRTSRRIPFARLQSVDINQPFVARLAGLAELRLEMAGGSESTTSLRFLRVDQAQQLRALLLDRKRGAHPRSDADGDATPAHPDDDRRSLITAVAPQQLVLGALVSLDFLTMLALTGVGMGVVIGFDVPWAAIGGVFGFAYGMFQIISSRVITQWGFTLTRGDRGLRIVRGMFARTSQTVPFDRVQGIRAVEPYVWRRLGWVRLDVDVAGNSASSSDGGESHQTLLPIGSRALAGALVEELIPDPAADQALEVRLDERARLFAPIGWKYRWLRRSADTVSSASGWISRHTSVVPHHKVQSVAVVQGPWQRRRGLATVQVHTPDGPVDVALGNLDRLVATRVALDEITRARTARALRAGRTSPSAAAEIGLGSRIQGSDEVTAVEPPVGQGDPLG